MSSTGIEPAPPQLHSAASPPTKLFTFLFKIFFKKCLQQESNPHIPSFTRPLPVLLSYLLFYLKYFLKMPSTGIKPAILSFTRPFAHLLSYFLF